MKIRGKLLTLILIPLLAVSAAAVWGFRDQSVKTEQAEEALTLAEESATVQRVIVAYGNERLALYADSSSAEINELRSITDEAVASAGLSADVVAAARGEGERTVSAERYTDAIADLRSTSSAAGEVYESDQLLTSIAAHSIYGVLEARETAWFDYVETAELRAANI